MKKEEAFVKEIEQTAERILRPEKIDRRIEYKRKMNPILYWMSLLVAIVGNILVSIIFIPILLLMKGVVLYFIVMIIGLLFGMLFNLLVKDIEYVNYRNHLIAGIFIPAIAIIDVYYIVKISNSISDKIPNAPHQDAVLLSILYVISFVIPYVSYKLMSVVKERKAAA